MSKNLLVTVKKKTSNGVESWEGTAVLPGFQPTKLTKSKGVAFSSRSALTNAAKRLAVRYGFDKVEFDGVVEEKKKSSKKTVKTVNETVV